MSELINFNPHWNYQKTILLVIFLIMKPYKNEYCLEQQKVDAKFLTIIDPLASHYGFILTFRNYRYHKLPHVTNLDAYWEKWKIYLAMAIKVRIKCKRKKIVDTLPEV